MDQLNTRLLDLMKTSGVREVRRVLGKYVQQLKSARKMIPGVTVTSDPTKFGQGMILPTTNALKQHSPVAAKKNEISPAAKCSSSTAPCTTGDRILTCSFDLKETFQLMNSTGRSSAKRYSNRLGKTRRNQNRQEIQERVINDAP
ncbi:activator of 90 kDa heat shock protein ATPase homolog 1-like isoform X2 [Oreochromis niloticus]|uniref:activator of 90 kDa heat shock protein ATPase homolog 1-like isoform X2 n=1 Tax=Oreochromis niloticus TaxID=8128 RepID=UPI0009055CE1|nr:activator of 90 kDa heat shock protein ATPase homolog 1-like isoform X2 [Oreochromis niloticus]